MRASKLRNIISSFAWISQFTALAVSDCQVGADQKALCTADISDSWTWVLLGGSSVGISGVISRVAILIALLKVLTTLLLSKP